MNATQPRQCLSKKLIEWARKCCANGAVVLANVWTKFRKATFGIFKTSIAAQAETLAGLSFKMFRSFLQPGEKYRIVERTIT